MATNRSKAHPNITQKEVVVSYFKHIIKMATFSTQWILDFTDKVTKPVKDMGERVFDSVNRMSGGYRFSEKDSREATLKKALVLKGYVLLNTIPLSKASKLLGNPFIGTNGGSTSIRLNHQALVCGKD